MNGNPTISDHPDSPPPTKKRSTSLCRSQAYGKFRDYSNLALQQIYANRLLLEDRSRSADWFYDHRLDRIIIQSISSRYFNLFKKQDVTYDMFYKFIATIDYTSIIETKILNTNVIRCGIASDYGSPLETEHDIGFGLTEMAPPSPPLQTEDSEEISVTISQVSINVQNSMEDRRSEVATQVVPSENFNKWILEVDVPCMLIVPRHKNLTGLLQSMSVLRINTPQNFNVYTSIVATDDIGHLRYASTAIVLMSTRDSYPDANQFDAEARIIAEQMIKYSPRKIITIITDLEALPAFERLCLAKDQLQGRIVDRLMAKINLFSQALSIYHALRNLSFSSFQHEISMSYHKGVIEFK